VASLVTLKHYAGNTAPYVLLIEQNSGQELWVRYETLGWKAYHRGEGGGELGWESGWEASPQEGGVPGGAT